jgi:hypothetical protein
VREDDPSPPVGECPVDDGIRRFDVCRWAFVYRKAVDENSDHARRSGIRALDKPSLRTSGEQSGLINPHRMRPNMRRNLAPLHELHVHARQRPAIVPPLIELRDGHGSRDADLAEPRSRASTPKGAAAIGGAAPIPESGPLGGVHQGPELRAPVRDAADGVVSAELPFQAELCSAPVAGAIQLVQGVEPCGKKGVAPLKRSRRRWFGIVRPDPHGGLE